MLDYHHNSRPASPNPYQRSVNEPGWVSPMNRSPTTSPPMNHSFEAQYEITRPHTSSGHSGVSSSRGQYADSNEYSSPNSLLRDLRLLKPRPRPGPRPAPREAPGPAPRIAPSMIPRPASPQVRTDSRPGSPLARYDSYQAAAVPRPSMSYPRPESPRPSMSYTRPESPRPSMSHNRPESPRSGLRPSTTQMRPESPQARSGPAPASSQTRSVSPHLTSKPVASSSQTRQASAPQARSTSPHLIPKSKPSSSPFSLKLKSASPQAVQNSTTVSQSPAPVTRQLPVLPRTSSAQAQQMPQPAPQATPQVQQTPHITSQMQPSKPPVLQAQPRPQTDSTQSSSAARLTLWPNVFDSIPVPANLAATLESHSTQGGPRPGQVKRVMTNEASNQAPAQTAQTKVRHWQSVGNLDNKKSTQASFDKELPALPQEHGSSESKGVEGRSQSAPGEARNRTPPRGRNPTRTPLGDGTEEKDEDESDGDEESSTFSDMLVSKLDVEIPTTTFDRFSVMFPSFTSQADRRATILARRQEKGQAKGQAIGPSLTIEPPPVPQLPAVFRSILDRDMRRERGPPPQLSPIKILQPMSTEAPLASSPLLPDIPSSGSSREKPKPGNDMISPRSNLTAGLKTPMPPLIQAHSSDSVQTVVPAVSTEEFSYNDESDPNANYDLISSYASPSPPLSPMSNEGTSTYAVSSPSLYLDAEPSTSLPPTPISEILHLLPSTPASTNSLSPHPLFYNKETRPASPLSQTHSASTHKFSSHKHTPSTLDLAEEGPLSPHLVLAQTVRLSRANKSMIKGPSQSSISEIKLVPGVSPKLTPTASPKLLPAASPKITAPSSPKVAKTPPRIRTDDIIKPRSQITSSPKAKTLAAPSSANDKNRPKSKALPPTPPMSATGTDPDPDAEDRPPVPSKVLPPTPPPESFNRNRKASIEAKRASAENITSIPTTAPAPATTADRNSGSNSGRNSGSNSNNAAADTPRKTSIAERVARADEAILRLARAQKALQSATRSNSRDQLN